MGKAVTMSNCVGVSGVLRKEGVADRIMGGPTCAACGRSGLSPLHNPVMVGVVWRASWVGRVKKFTARTAISACKWGLGSTEGVLGIPKVIPGSLDASLGQILCVHVAEYSAEFGSRIVRRGSGHTSGRVGG